MRSLKFFYRHTNPLFFSIERVFGAIATEIRERFPSEFAVEEDRMPLVSKPRNLLKNIRFTRRHQADINHVTGDVHYALLGCARSKVNVLTIHDCVSVQKYRRRDPRYWIIKWVWYNWPVSWADHVTVISESTKRDLLQLVHTRPEKVTVISNFIDPSFFPVPAVFNAARPRILFIGTTPNKNLGRLALALKDIPVLLDIVGDLNDEQQTALETSGVRYEQSARLSGEQLLAKYRDCDLLAFPTTYEGFGLPIVEAQTVGRPVLTSDLSPMREVAGEGACLIDPYDPGSIREGLLRILSEPLYREQLVEKGARNINRFSLDQVTQQYITLYRQLIGRKVHPLK
jgi:glycosyltransferase involved in cell wall biosynthesis